MILKSIKIAGGLDKLLDFITDTKPKTVFDFDLSNPKDSCYERNLLSAVCAHSKNFNVDKTMVAFTRDEVIDLMSTKANLKTNEELDLLVEFFNNLQRIFYNNAYEMEEPTGDHPIEDDDVRLMGCGIFPFASLFNHSCFPNIDRITVDNKLAFFVKRPVKAGEQLFISYGMNSAVDHRDERQKKLLERFQFQCDCFACTNAIPLVMPISDIQFEPPKFSLTTVEDAVEQIKKNCEYIDLTFKNEPSTEIILSMYSNKVLLQRLAGVVLPASKAAFE